MRILAHSFDLDDLGGSGISLRTVLSYLEKKNHTVWATDRLDPSAVSWGADVMLSHQWATEPASHCATELKIPLVMFVHGPGQYEYFMAACDLVVFNTECEKELARQALGRTPCMVLHPPVFAA